MTVDVRVSRGYACLSSAREPLRTKRRRSREFMGLKAYARIGKELVFEFSRNSVTSSSAAYLCLA